MKVWKKQIKFQIIPNQTTFDRKWRSVGEAPELWKKFPLLIRASIYEDNQPLLNQVLAIKRFNTLECVHLDLDFCLRYDIAFPTILNTLAQQTPVPLIKLFMDLRLFSIQRDAQFIDYLSQI